MRVIAARERRIEGLFGIQAEPGDAPVAGFELHQHFAEARVAGRAGHQADMRRPFENLLAFLLRHAAQHAEDFAFARFALEILQTVENLLLGLVANAARVEKHQSGRIRRRNLRVALGQERACDLFGVVGIHLAAECFQVEGFP